MSHQFFFSPHILDHLALPAAGFDVVQDAAEPALRLYVTARGIKTFFTRKRVRGRDVRIIIGRYPEMDIDTARARVLGAIDATRRPILIRRRGISFGDLAARFVVAKIRRAPASRAKLIRTMARHLGELYPIPVNEINPAQISKIIQTVAKTSGAPTANRMRESASGVMKFAIESGYITENPAAEIPPVPESRRARHLTDVGIVRLIAAIRAEKNRTMRGAFLMLIYGFANKTRVFSMRWSDLDFNGYTWGSRPLSDASVVLLRDLPQDGRFVFPGRAGGSAIKDPRGAWARVVAAARLRDVRMDDVHKFLMRKLTFSPDREQLRRNMNKVVEELTEIR